MVVRYEHGSEERDASLAQALSPLTKGSNAVPIATSPPARSRTCAHNEDEAEGEVVALPPLTSTNDERCSGGETRTLNEAGSLEEGEY
jgi:hypothetical protein